MGKHVDKACLLLNDYESQDAMRRFLIFLLLGPALGYLVGLCVVLPVFDVPLGRAGLRLHLTDLKAAYALGVLPAILSCIIDRELASHAVQRRPIWMALISFATSLVPVIPLLPATFDKAPSPWILILLYGMCGAVSGLICSALSSAYPRANPSSAEA